MVAVSSPEPMSVMIPFLCDMSGSCLFFKMPKGIYEGKLMVNYFSGDRSTIFSTQSE
jgi:hypothetical protein